MPSSPEPPPLTGTLQIYRRTPVALSYFDTDPSLPHTLLFVPGLTDTIGTIPYLPSLATSIAPLGFSLVQPVLTCQLGGYGQCTLEGDSQEIAACIAHLRTTREKKGGRVVVMGHSTGCQDAIAYLLSSGRASEPSTRIDGAILQAPVSDRESYELQRESASDQERVEMDAELAHATKLVEEGRGSTLMPRKDISLPTDPHDPATPAAAAAETDTRKDGNVSAVHSLAMTGYRMWSLKARGGHDDFFSCDLDDFSTTSTQPGSRTIGRAIHNLVHSATEGKILALIGGKE